MKQLLINLLSWIEFKLILIEEKLNGKRIIIARQFNGTHEDCKKYKIVVHDLSEDYGIGPHVIKYEFDGYSKGDGTSIPSEIEDGDWIIKDNKGNMYAMQRHELDPYHLGGSNVKNLSKN